MTKPRTQFRKTHVGTVTIDTRDDYALQQLIWNRVDRTYDQLETIPDTHWPLYVSCGTCGSSTAEVDRSRAADFIAWHVLRTKNHQRETETMTITLSRGDTIELP